MYFIILDASKVTKVEVQVYSKNITLPQNKVTLSAFVIPEAKPPNSYKYEWNLITGIIIIVIIKKNHVVAISRNFLYNL